MDRQCVFCNRTDEHDKKTDHIRAVYLYRDGRFDKGFFQPRLSEAEISVLRSKGGLQQDICSNRNSCRRRKLSLKIKGPY